jgi:uncharacterized membrane protein YgcG
LAKGVHLITQWHLRNAQRLFADLSFQPKLTLPPHHRRGVFVGRDKVMRRLVVLLLLAATAASGGGCVTSTDSIADQGAPGNPGSGGSNGGGSTSGGGGTDPSSGLAGDTSGTAGRTR